jgi:hypothetical protein
MLSRIEISEDTVFANGFFAPYERIKLISFFGEVANRPIYAARFYVGENHVSSAALTKEDFLTLYHAVKPEVRDDLNVLGIGMKNAPSKDQLQGAGTNNFTQV